VHIELICSLEMPQADQFDMAVVYEKPSANSLKIAAEHDLCFGLFASHSYLEKYGYPKNLNDLAQNHRLCGRNNYPFVWSKWNDIVQKADHLAAVTNSSGMLMQLIKEGVGVGLLPVRMAKNDPQLVYLSKLKLSLHHKFWIVVREDVQDIDKIKALTDFIEHASDRL
jgi:DNA-binding transcriptional LysR family regulator